MSFFVRRAYYMYVIELCGSIRIGLYITSHGFCNYKGQIPGQLHYVKFVVNVHAYEAAGILVRVRVRMHACVCLRGLCSQRFFRSRSSYLTFIIFHTAYESVSVYV
jgi:hypothetical protein